MVAYAGFHDTRIGTWMALQKHVVVSTISLALIAADTWLWTLIDLSNNEDDIYEMHVQMHEEMDAE